jgi:hypothetical protein
MSALDCIPEGPGKDVILGHARRAIMDAVQREGIAAWISTRRLAAAHEAGLVAEVYKTLEANADVGRELIDALMKHRKIDGPSLAPHLQLIKPFNAPAWPSTLKAA